MNNPVIPYERLLETLFSAQALALLYGDYALVNELVDVQIYFKEHASGLAKPAPLEGLPPFQFAGCAIPVLARERAIFANGWNAHARVARENKREIPRSGSSVPMANDKMHGPLTNGLEQRDTTNEEVAPKPHTFWCKKNHVGRDYEVLSVDAIANNGAAPLAQVNYRHLGQPKRKLVMMVTAFVEGFIPFPDKGANRKREPA